MKKILSVLLCICMVMTLIPATVMANEINGVYINGVNFPMGDGSTTTYYKNGINGGSAGSESDWNAKLYNDNGTLTLVLNGFEYYGDQVGIYATEDLKIVLEGTGNSITTESYGIWVQGDLEITGNYTCRIDIDAEGDYAIEANTQNPSDYATITINSVTEVQAKGRVGAISAEEAVVIIDSYIEPVGSDFGIKGGGYYQGQAKNITVKGKSDVYASGHTPFYSAPIVDGAFEWTDYYAGGWQDYTENTQYDEDWIDANYIQLRYNRNGGSNDGNEELEYYLIGTINNGDCYDEEYKFVGGKVDIEFTSPAYVGVMDSQRNFYYAENFPGMSPTEVVLGIGNSASNRMYIPASGNYTFWLTVNDDGTVTLSLNQPVVTTYTVSFDANGGTGSMADVNDVTGEYTLPACTFTAPDGKQFKAWSVDGNEKNVGDTITVSANTTVSAVWENIPAPTYTVTFNANGHGSAPNAITGVEEGSKITAPAAPTAEGFTFEGWYKEASCVNAWDFENDTATENTTLYAKWTEVNQSVTYENYHIISDDLTHVQTVLDGVADVTKDSETGVVTIIFTENIFGRIWIGEDNFNDMSGKFVIDLGGKTIDPGDKEEAICFDNNFEGTAIITGEGVLKTGRNHIIYCNGWEEVWFDVAEGKDYFTLKLDGEDLYSETEKHTEAKSYDSYDSYGGDVLTLTQGVFETYTVTFNTNGKGVAPEAIENVKEGSKITAPAAPTAEGFTFEGWYKEATCENAWNFGNDTVTENTTLYAKWTETAEEPETYTITFDANGGSVTPANVTTGVDGKLATLPTPTRSGSYTFKGWYTAASGGTQVTVDKVYTENTTIYAQWNYTGSTGGGGGVSRYTVKFDTNGGTTVANKTVTRNSKLAEPTAPTKDGYTFDGWCTDKELTTAYDFDTKVTKSFTLYAKWVEAKATHVCPSEKFSDLDTTKWYHEDIDYVLDKEIMLGTSDTVFAPEGSLTRGMLVTILYRSEGEPATNKSIPFADVDMSAYYANAVVWAQQNGIVKGISETEYAPEMSVTREQLATVMFRYAQFKGMDAVTAEENLGFNDASDISDWAVAAMNWGVGRDYIFSRTKGDIAPKVAATRAEIAAFIHRYIVDTAK